MNNVTVVYQGAYQNGDDVVQLEGRDGERFVVLEVIQMDEDDQEGGKVTRKRVLKKEPNAIFPDDPSEEDEEEEEEEEDEEEEEEDEEEEDPSDEDGDGGRQPSGPFAPVTAAVGEAETIEEAVRSSGGSSIFL
jgi:hypothetical protein